MFRDACLTNISKAARDYEESWIQCASDRFKNVIQDVLVGKTGFQRESICFLTLDLFLVYSLLIYEECIYTYFFSK